MVTKSTDTELLNRLAAAYDTILAAGSKALAQKTANRESLTGNTRTAASTGDANRCQRQCTPEPTRAQVAEG